MRRSHTKWAPLKSNEYLTVYECDLICGEMMRGRVRRVEKIALFPSCDQMWQLCMLKLFPRHWCESEMNADQAADTVSGSVSALLYSLFEIWRILWLLCWFGWICQNHLPSGLLLDHVQFSPGLTCDQCLHVLTGWRQILHFCYTFSQVIFIIWTWAMSLKNSQRFCFGKVFKGFLDVDFSVVWLYCILR